MLIVGAVLLAAVVIAVLSRGEAPPPAADDIPTSVPIGERPHYVHYSIGGTAETVDVVMQSPAGAEQTSNATLPQGISYEMSSGDFTYVQLQNCGESGEVTCQIYVDGDVISENTSSGPHSIVTCEGTVP
ncbi:hypothetical protein Psi02_61200 [Planotetraspora silvatica]|uniref:Uncharacterized protein n=2 Tax=Planotetraspora silvatica TaxID=234614 RepID=A0A8J3UUF6_9ACTN|nr:hypothetical protein Psi02_61200 [Planotetraspora silvatica]